MFSNITTCHVCAVAKADASTDTVCLSLSLSLMCEYEHARHVCCPVPLLDGTGELAFSFEL